MRSIPPTDTGPSRLPAWSVAEWPFGIRLLDVGIVALVIVAIEVNVIVGTGPGAVPLNIWAYLDGAVLAVPILFRRRWPFRVMIASAVRSSSTTSSPAGTSRPPRCSSSRFTTRRWPAT